MRPLLPLVLGLGLSAPPAALPTRDAASVYVRSKAAVLTIRTDKGSGTGFAVGDGSLVLTCWHVVKDASWVRTDETGGSSVKIVGVDQASDVALLRLSRPRKRRLVLRPGSVPEPGTRVYAIGTSLGFLDHTLSEGIVSGRRIHDGVSYLQVTAAVSHGNSGSPVLDEQGRVVGMADFVMDGESLNFAVASRELGSAVASIQARERARRVAARTNGETKPKTVLGRLAVSRRATTIRSAPGKDAEVIYDAKKGTYMVARTQPSEGWLPIVLQSGRLGYARAEDVDVLGNLVTSETPRHIDASPVAEPPAASAESRLAGTLIAADGLLHKGAKYVEGGTSLENGVGSGEFVMLLYAAQGYELPASPAEQSKVGEKVGRYEDLVEGDRLYLWDPKAGRIGLAAVYIGGGNVAMADPKARKVVTTFLTAKIRQATIVARRGGPRKQVPSEHKGGSTDSSL